MADATVARPSLADSLGEYGRGLAGGLLFSLPLLYTMEVWWAGFLAGPERLLALLAATFLVLLAYNRVAGMHPDASWIEVVIDSVEELGLGLLTAALVLWLIGRIGDPVPPREALGKVVVEAMVVAIGFSVGTAQLGEGLGGRPLAAHPRPGATLGGRLTIALCGAILFAANVAPTEEIVVIAVETGPLRLLGLVLLSLLIAGATLALTGRRHGGGAGERDAGERDGGEREGGDRGKGSGGGGARRGADRGVLGLAAETLAVYTVGLVVSAAILWFFGRFEGLAWNGVLRHTVALALPASLGAGAGRALLEAR